MPKKRKQDRKKKQPSPSELRRAAERRERHARLVLERDGDPNFVQQTRHADGSRTVTADAETVGGLRRQRQAFIEKFGHEPEPDDPVFFDPTADDPQPMQDFDWDKIFAAVDAAGLDPAIPEAWRELGYLVTEMNQHMFTAHEVEAWNEAVERHSGE